MTVNAITDTKKGRTGIAPTYLPHFLTAYSMSLSKLHELQSGFAAFPQKKTIYVTKNAEVFMSKT